MLIRCVCIVYRGLKYDVLIDVIVIGTSFVSAEFVVGSSFL